jgi:hypothetical protein
VDPEHGRSCDREGGSRLVLITSQFRITQFLAQEKPHARCASIRAHQHTNNILIKKRPCKVGGIELSKPGRKQNNAMIIFSNPESTQGDREGVSQSDSNQCTQFFCHSLFRGSIASYHTICLCLKLVQQGHLLQSKPPHCARHKQAQLTTCRLLVDSTFPS